MCLSSIYLPKHCSLFSDLINSSLGAVRLLLARHEGIRTRVKSSISFSCKDLQFVVYTTIMSNLYICLHYRSSTHVYY